MNRVELAAHMQKEFTKCREMVKNAAAALQEAALGPDMGTLLVQASQTYQKCWYVAACSAPGSELDEAAEIRAEAARILKEAKKAYVCFFDSHGQAWTPCSGEHPEAKAFGPTGVSRLLEEGELRALGLFSEQWTAHYMAKGRLVRAEEAHEWDHLAS
jgi:hypothetical protein